MKTELDREASRLALGFAQAGELRDFFERAASEGGFLVALPAELRFRQTLRISARSADGVEFECDAEVSGVSRTTSGEFATALLLGGWGSDHSERLRLALRTARRERQKAASDGSAADDPTPDAAVAGETLGASPMHRIREMNPNQRTLLARKAGRIERQILLNDSSPQVLQGLLVNPRIEAKDVVRLVKSTHTTAPVLKRIVEDGRWGQNQEILGLVARNPKTPTPVAIRLIDKLRTSDLRMMAKLSSGVRDNIRRAALREYMRRSGQ